MPKKTISVTEAARDFADCVNRVHYQNATFVLLKNGLPVARLGPVVEKSCLGRDLAKALARTDLSDEEVKNWSRDLRKTRKALKTPADKGR
jgi:hypothetical protein